MSKLSKSKNRNSLKSKLDKYTSLSYKGNTSELNVPLRLINKTIPENRRAGLIDKFIVENKTKIKNELVKEVTTDKNGEFTVKLPYGSYTLKQLTTTKGYEYAKDYKLNIDIDGKVIKEVLSNAEITAKLKVIKIDKDTGEVIKRSGIKFKIKSLKFYGCF